MYNKRPILTVAFAILAPLVTLTANAVNMKAGDAGGSTTTPIPPPHGPHVILSVPLELDDLPPEIDEYSVTCYAWNNHPTATGRSTGVGTSIIGKGTASGAVPPAANSKEHQTFKATATVGVFIDFPPKFSWVPARVADQIASATWYRCELTLSGTAYSVKTTYLSNSITIPQAPNKPYAQSVQGQLPH